MTVSVHSVVKKFLKAQRKEFQLGDRVKVVEDQYKPLGLYGRTGVVQQIRGRGWYTVKMDTGDFYNFFTGAFASDIEHA
jgi:hypothetical protein